VILIVNGRRGSKPRRFWLQPREPPGPSVWACEFRFCGEEGWDARLTRGVYFFASHRFLRREAAEQWAADQRRDIERGSFECK